MGGDLPGNVKGNGANLSAIPAGRLFVEGAGPGMRVVEAAIRELAQSDVPVVILAEPGAGKHVAAKRIHDLSRRKSEPFRTLDSATAGPEDLVVVSAGKGTARSPGTVFLREVASLSIDCQRRLLENLPKAAEENIPGSRRRPRLICGSARDLELEVKAGRLREDLYYRLSGVCLRLPPLRQRREDIPDLIDHFLKKYASDFHRPVPPLSSATLQLFQDYSWPGNLRELEDAAKALVALGDENIAMDGLRAMLRKPAASGNGGAVSLKQAARAASREAERELILQALTRTRWNRRRAAQELQISYKALLYKLKQIGCEAPGAS
jgi:two-component system response regulator AtoC